MTHDWTSPETALFERMESMPTETEDAILATIVDVEGNAYRRPGAKMLLDGEGSFGSITAGCLEDEVRMLAGPVLDDGRPRIETFDLMEDDDVWGLGMGCHGIIDILLEPLGPNFRPAVEAHRNRNPIAVVTVLDSSNDEVIPFERTFYRPEDGFHASLPAGLPAEFEPTVETILQDGTSRTVSVETNDGTVTVFVDSITPPPELVVVGSGPDVDPVVELAWRNNFQCTVIGYRGGELDSDRFPAADVYSTSPRSVRSCHHFDDDTYVVIMTHNYVDDRLTVESLLETPVPYLALVGAQERADRLVEELHDEGTLERNDVERIYAPAGLDLGGGSPNQIATSIVAELLSVHNDREPDHLRSRTAPIHERGRESDTP